MSEETKTCRRCGKDKPLSAYHKGGSGKLKPTCHSCYNASYCNSLKLEVFSSLGGKCSCCGIDHPYFLSLEHVEGIGKGNRDGKNVQQLYEEAKRSGYDKTKFELLCMNCNWAKGLFGECPHKSGITKEQAYFKLVAEILQGRSEVYDA